MLPYSSGQPWSECLQADKFLYRDKAPGSVDPPRARSADDGEKCSEDPIRPHRVPQIRSTEGCSFAVRVRETLPRGIVLPTEEKHCKRSSGRERHTEGADRCTHDIAARSIEVAISRNVHKGECDSGRSRQTPRRRRPRTRPP